MYTVDTKKGKTSFDPKAKKSTQEATANIFYFDAEEDLKALSGPELLDVFNAAVRSAPELKVNETHRFSTREVGEKRTWGMLVRIKALSEDGGEEAVPDKKTKTEGAPKKKRAPGKAREAGERKITDKEVKRASKVYPPKEGSNQDKALKLISRPGGIAVDDFVTEMNKGERKGKWSRGNAWSALVYILHTTKGYGIRCKDGILTIL